jgi:hypothetical protein
MLNGGIWSLIINIIRYVVVLIGSQFSSKLCLNPFFENIMYIKISVALFVWIDHAITISNLV